MYSSLLELLGGDGYAAMVKYEDFFYLVGIVHPKKTSSISLGFLECHLNGTLMILPRHKTRTFVEAIS